MLLLEVKFTQIFIFFYKFDLMIRRIIRFTLDYPVVFTCIKVINKYRVKHYKSYQIIYVIKEPWSRPFRQDQYYLKLWTDGNKYCWPETMVLILRGNSLRTELFLRLPYGICLDRQQTQIWLFSPKNYYPSNVRNLFWITI